MTASDAILYFIGIPLALAALISLAVAAPSWTRSSRGRATSAAEAETDTTNLLIHSNSAAPNPSILPSEISAEASDLKTGGAHASW